jgi:hypothetical protein
VGGHRCLRRNDEKKTQSSFPGFNMRPTPPVRSPTSTRCLLTTITHSSTPAASKKIKKIKK